MSATETSSRNDSTKWVWWSRRAVLDEHRSGLTFTDILFGLVLAEIFRRGNELAEISWAGRAHLGVAVVLVAASWIGYHNSLKRSDYQSHFFNLPLFLFVLDLIMVFSYWLLAINPEGLPELQRSASFDPSALLEANVVLLVFFLYLLWDLGSWRMTESQKYPNARHDWKRTLVTLSGLGATLLVAVVVWIKDPSTGTSVIAVDLALIGILVWYRWAKDGFQRGVDATEATL